jgi:hypothetical protein
MTQGADEGIENNVNVIKKLGRGENQPQRPQTITRKERCLVVKKNGNFFDN